MRILGAGGGGKGGSANARKPDIQKDSIGSTSTIKILYGLAEGEIDGLVNGAKSIYLEGTPLVDDNGHDNFSNVAYSFNTGTNDQDYIKGFPDVSNETGINVKLQYGTAWIKSIVNTELSAVRVRLKFGRLSETHSDTGDVTGTTVKYAIDLQTASGAYQTIIDTQVNDKASAGYERTHRIDLPQSKTGWQIRVRRLTPNSNSDLLQNDMYVDAIAEVIDVKLNYPNTAMLGLEYDAETFQNVAKVAVHCRGMRVKVPSNYNPVARQYTGIWNGSFKIEYSNNPAWVYYDLLTQWRYGLGERLDSTMIDKWSLYQLGQYCDQLVSDGKNGTEPRFTCNVYLQKQEDAFTVLSNIAGIFRAMSYWNGEHIVLDADVPQDPVFTFSRANVIDGQFSYTGTRQRDRHTLAKVAWDDPDNKFETQYEYVRDEKAMAKYGVKLLDLSAFGCTSQAQAQRAGLWALKTEQLETRQVGFSVGLDGFIPQVGNIINVSDELFAGRANGGRVSIVNGRTITLDRALTAGDVLLINGSDGKTERRDIESIAGTVVTVTAAFSTAEPQNVWAVEAADLKLMRFRVMSITGNDDNTFNLSAIQHEPQKYDAIDVNTDVKPTQISIVQPDIIAPPTTVTLSARHRIVQSQTVATLVIEWSQVKNAIAYDAEWRKDDGQWIRLPRTGNMSADIEGVYSGNYLARVRSISAFDITSQPTTSMLTAIAGKAGAPPKLATFKATGVLFGMHLDWSFASGSGDANYIEIEQGTAPNTNAIVLGQFSYPTNKHDITGLQGGLTIFYRARLVDKLGFKSDWTAWTSGTTDASASKVLDLLNGQITESQLYQTLGTKIEKIATNEVALNSEIQARIYAISDSNQRIINETNARIAAINEAKALTNTERSDRIAAITQSAAEQQLALQQKADALSLNISQANTKIDAEAQARITAVTNLQTGINTEQQQRQNADSALSSRVDSVVSKTDSNTAAIASEATTRTNQDSALSSRIDTTVAKVDANTSAITAEQTTRANAVSAVTSKVDTISAKTESNAAAIQSEATTRTNNDATLSSQINAVSSAFDNNKAQVQTQIQTLTNKDSAQASKLDYLSSELSFDYADQNRYVDSGRSTAWTFAKTVAQQDWINAEATRGLFAELGKTKANFTEQITTNVTKTEAVTKQITDLSAQMIGGYQGNDLSQLTSGLLHQERQTRATAVEGLSQQISLLSAGVGEQFDPFMIWHFNNDSEGWTGGTYNSGYINARSDKIVSPTISDLDGNAYHHIKFRMEKVGSPTWWGVIDWSGGALGIAPPNFVDNVATVNANVSWPKAVTQFSMRLADTADNANYYKVDWIAVGRPSPGASFSALLNEQRTRASADQALTQSITQLNSDLNTKTTQLSSSINQQIQTLTDKQSTQANQLTTLDSKVDSVDNRLSSQITQFNSTLSSNQQAQATQLNKISAQIDLGYADSTQYANANRSVQWTLANALANADYTLNERVTKLQTDFNSNSASFSESIKTLTDKDSAQAIKIDQLDSKVNTANTDLSSRITTVNNTLTSQQQTQATQLNQVSSRTTTAQTTADNANARIDATNTQLTNANSLITKNSADIQTEQTARINADSGLAGRIDTVQSATTTAQNTADTALGKASTATTNIAAIQNELTATTSKANANASQINTVAASAQSAQNTANDAQSRINTTNAELDNAKTLITQNNAAIQAEQTARANADSGLASRIDTVQSSTTTAQNTADTALGKANTATSNIAAIKTELTATTSQTNATANQVTTLQTTVNGHTSSIQTQQSSISGLKAQYTVKLDVDGKVSGFGLASSATQSDFAIRADKFYIAPPSGASNGVKPFTVLTSPQTINGITVPAGTYIDGSLVATGSISGDKIRANTSITAPVINGGSININDKFKVDSNGNMSAIGGYFEGNIAANSIDIATLKRSAWTPSYRMYVSRQFGNYTPDSFDKSYGSSHVSYGAIVMSLGSSDKSYTVGSALYEVEIDAVSACTITQQLLSVDDSLRIYLNNVKIHDISYSSVGGGVDIAYNLTAGRNTIQIVLINNDGPVQLVLLGDFIDNMNVRFA